MMLYQAITFYTSKNGNIYNNFKLHYAKQYFGIYQLGSHQMT